MMLASHNSTGSTFSTSSSYSLTASTTTTSFSSSSHCKRIPSRQALRQANAQLNQIKRAEKQFKSREQQHIIKQLPVVQPTKPLSSPKEQYLMFSKYEARLIKEVWISLDVCLDFDMYDSTTTIQYDVSNRDQFESRLATKLFEFCKPASSSGEVSLRRGDILERFELSISRENLARIAEDYQIHQLVELITMVIHQLSSNQGVVSYSYISQVSKQTSRIYQMTMKHYIVFAECLVSTIIEVTMVNAQEQFVFNKFLTSLFAVVGFYINEKQVILEQTPKSLLLSQKQQQPAPATIQSLHLATFTPTLQPSAEFKYHSSDEDEDEDEDQDQVPSLLASYDLTTPPPPPPTTTTTGFSSRRAASIHSSVYSLPSTHTERSSCMSLRRMDSLSTYDSFGDESLSLKDIKDFLRRFDDEESVIGDDVDVAFDYLNIFSDENPTTPNDNKKKQIKSSQKTAKKTSPLASTLVNRKEDAATGGAVFGGDLTKIKSKSMQAKMRNKILNAGESALARVTAMDPRLAKRATNLNLNGHLDKTKPREADAKLKLKSNSNLNLNLHQVETGTSSRSIATGDTYTTTKKTLDPLEFEETCVIT
ncbi:uncharacterized protein LODBEIA_P44300 [Lodderomyces beijingensis]|uniref:Uncharacterized protein n=1 Tax=Lodderomyces beijingensis TaxID=1775926 RepID=A0ABP0ZSX3_9ASCO